MVAVVNGSGLGLFTSRGSSGSAGLGQSRDQVFVNSTTGNLVIQGVDEILTATGSDIAVTRTYNSLGITDGDNNDGWRVGVLRSLVINAGVSIVKTFGDGARVTYNWNGTEYVSTEGDGAHDKIAASGSNWVWTDGSGRNTETYDSTGKLLNSKDQSGNTVTYSYGSGVTANVIVQIVSVSPSVANGGDGTTTTVDFTYNPGTLDLEHISTTRNGVPDTLTYYTYDGQHRLSTVTVDLSPANNSTSDSDTLVTTYTYQGTTNLVASITQKKGGSATVTASVSFTYQLIDNDYRLKTYTDGEAHTTTFTYTTAVTTSATNSTANANSGVLSTTETQNVTNTYNLNSAAVSTTDTTTNTYNVNSAALTTNATQTNTYNRNDAALSTTDTTTNTYNLNSGALTTPTGGAWSTPTFLDSMYGSGSIAKPEIVLDANGNGIGVWSQLNTSTSSTDLVWSRYTRASNSWSFPQVLTTQSNGAVSPIAIKTSLTIDSAGNVLVAWNQLMTPSIANAFAARYDAATGVMSSATNLGTSKGLVTGAISGGSAVVTFLVAASMSTNNLVARRYSSGTWAASQTISAAAGTFSTASVAIDSQGNINAVFAAGTTVVRNRFTASTSTWSGVSSLAATAGNDVSTAVDSNGNGFAVWEQGGDIMMSRYTRSNNTWTAATAIESSAQTAQGPNLAMDGAGNAMVIWQQSDGTSLRLFAKRFNVSSSTWGSVTAVDNTTQLISGPADNKSVSISGNFAAATWLQYDGTRWNVYSSTFNGTSWSTPANVESSSDNSYVPRLSVDPLGNVIELWAIDGDGSLYFNRFSAGGGGAPYYTVPAGATWQSIANALYGINSAAAGTALQTAMGNPALTTGAQLTGWPATLSVTTTVTVPAYYNVPAGATWQSIANAVYGINNAAAGTALQTAMGNPTLSTGLHLTGFPATLSVTTTLPAHYLVPAGATWQSIANALYGVNSAAAGTALQTALGNPSIATGQRLYNIPATLTVTTTVTVPAYYNVPAGATWQSIANAVYGVNSAAAGTALQTAMGNPTLSTGLHLTGFPATLSVTTTLAPHYLVPAGATWQSIANALYGVNSAAAGTALQTALGNPSIATGQRLYNIPSTLTVTTTVTVPAYYTIPASPSWQAIANTLYGVNSAAAGSALQTALGNPTLTPGNRLTPLPSTLSVTTSQTVTVPAYYVVPAGASWTSITQAVYGTSNPNAVAALQTATGNPTLTTNLHLTVPLTLTYTVTAASTIYRNTDVVDALGFMITYQTDTLGRLTNTFTPTIGGARIETRYGYDSEGNIATITQDPTGLNRVTTMTYSNGNLLSTRDSFGNTVTRTYSTTNQVLTETQYLVPDTGSGASGPMVTHYVYDSADRLRYVITPENRVTEHRYHQVTGLRLTTMVYTSAAYTTGTWTETALNTFATANQGQAERTNFYYDFRGNLSESRRFVSVDSGGVGTGTPSSTLYTYDARGFLKNITEARGAATTGDLTDYVTSFTYDGLGRQLTKTEWLDATHTRTTTTLWTDASRQFAITLTQTGGATGLVTTTTYDRAGVVTSVVNTSTASTALGTTSFLYDADNRHRVTIDPLLNKTYCIYDELSRKVGEVDAKGRLTQYVYDNVGELTKIIHYSSYLSTTMMSTLSTNNGVVDIGSLVADIATASGRDATKDQITRSTYDAAGRVTYTVDPNGGVTQFFYDGVSRLTGTLRYATTIGASAAPSSVTADAVNDRRTRNFYDNDGKLLATLDAQGFVVEYLYDQAGQLVHQIAYANPTSATNPYTDAFSLVRPATDTETVVDYETDGHTYFYYDGQGRQQAVLDAEGYLTESFFNVAGLVDSTTRYQNKATYNASLSTVRSQATGSNLSTGSTYDGVGRVTSTTNEEGTPTSFVYNALDEITSTTQTDRTTQTRYDELGRVTQTMGGEGSAQTTNAQQPTLNDIWTRWGVTYTLDAAGRRVKSTDQFGNKQYYYYDSDNRLRFTVVDLGDGTGEVGETKYDELGQVSDTYAYFGRINTSGLAGGVIDATFTNALNAVKDATNDAHASFTYKPAGQVWTSSNAEGALTTNSYNGFGELSGSVQKINASQNHGTSYEYDKRGLLTKSTEDAAGINHTMTYTYDAFGRRTSAKDQYNNTQRWEYDRLGRTVSTYSPVNAKRMTEYDAFSRLYRTYDAYNNMTSYSYNVGAKSMTMTTPENVVITTTHNEHGETVTVATTGGDTVSYQYDKNGNLVQTSDLLGTIESRTYDRAARLDTSMDARGVVTKIAYDGASRTFTRTQDFGGLSLVTTYVYDGLGRVKRVTEPGGHVTDTTYYRDGRVKMISVDPAGANLRTLYEYDAAGNSFKVTEHYLSSKPLVTQYNYDNLNRRIEEIVDGAGLNLRTQYKYDQNGNLTRKIEGSQLVAPPPAEQPRNTWFVYDAAGRNTQIVDALGGVTELTYDLENRVVARRRYATAVSVSGLGNVIAAVAPTANSTLDRVERTGYDRDGRAVYSINAKGGVTQRTFDASGNVVSTRLLRNEMSIAGNPTAADVAAAIATAGYGTVDANDRISWAAYDLRNRLVYSVDGLGGVAKYVYDATNNSIEVRQYASTYSGANKDKASLDTWLATTVSGQAYTVDNDPNNRITRTWYDTLGRVRYLQNGQGYVTETSYNDAARTTTEKTYYSGPYNISLATATSSVGGQLTSTPADDRYTTTELDVAGRLYKVTDSYGNYEQYSYDDAGNKQYFRNKNGNTWTYQYDVLGRVTDEITPLVNTYNLTETTAALSVGTAVSTSITTHLQYTSFGDVSKRTEAYGVSGVERTTEYVYDQLGRQIRTKYPAVGYYDGSSDSITRVGTAVVRTDAAAEVLYSEVTYDTLGDAVVNRDVAGNYSYRLYDQLGRNRFEVDAEGYVTEHALDRFGNETQLIRYANKFTGSMTGAPISYQGFATPASTTLDRTITKVYDRLNHKTMEYLPNVYWYSMDTAASSTIPATPTTNFYYNAFGELNRQAVLVTVNGAGTGTFANTYYYRDKLGRVIAEVDPLNYLTATEYDAAGNVKRTVEYAAALSSPANYATPTSTNPVNALGSTIGYDRETKYGYDRLNRVLTETAVNVEQSTTAGARANAPTVTVTYQYDAVGNQTVATDDAGSAVYTFYDALGRTVAVASPARVISTGGTTTATRWPLTVFKRDALGNVLQQITYASGASSVVAGSLPTPVAIDSMADEWMTSKYDATGHVLRTEDGTGADRFFAYTKRGDVAKEWQIVTTLDVTPLSEALATIRSYDKLGREVLVRAPQILPNGADLTATVIMRSEEAYNAFGELASRKTYDESTAAPTAEGSYETFAYDNAGRLWQTNSGDGVFKVYFYDLAGHKTVDLISRSNVLAPSVSSTAAVAANQTNQILRTETRFNLKGQAIEQRLPSFAALTDLRESIGSTLSVSIMTKFTGANVNAGYAKSTTGTGTISDPIKMTLIWSPGTAYASGGGYYRDGITRDSTHSWTSGRYIYWTDPATLVADSTQIFEYRLAGTNNAWTPRAIDKLGTGAGGGTRYLGAYVGDLPNNSYEFRIRYLRANEATEFTILTGTITNPATATTLTDTTASTIAAPSTVTPTTTQTFDRWGNVLSSTDAAMNTTNYRYDQHDQLIEKLLPTVSITAVDSNDGTISTTTGRPKQENFYDRFGHLIGTRDANSVVKSVTLNAAGQIVREDHADGGYKTFAYDVFGNRIREVDERGFLTTHKFDQRNLETRLQRESDLGAIDGNVSAKIVTTVFTYDEAGRKTRDASGGQGMTYFYDLRGNLRKRRTDSFNETKFEYDVRGFKVKETDALEGVKDWTYDYFGHALTHHELGTKTVSGGGATQTYTYGYTVGILHHYNYDSAGMLTDEDSDAGKHVVYSYDTAGHLTQVVENGTATGPSGLTTVARTANYTYDALGRHVREKTTVDGLVHQNMNIRYDALGRIASTWDISSDIAYSYDAAGNRTRMTSRSNSDAQAGVIVKNVTGGETDTYYLVSNGWYTDNYAMDVVVADAWFKYDKLGHMTISQGSNQSGKVLRVTTDSNSQSFTYDLSGNRKITTAYGPIVPPSGSGTYGDSIVEDFYDGLSRIIHSTDDGYDSAFYTYDAASRQSSATSKWFAFGSQAISQEVLSYYDLDGRLTSQTTTKSTNGGSKILQSRVTFDNAGRSLTWTTSGGAPYPITYTPNLSYSLGYDQTGTLRGYLMEDFTSTGGAQYYTSYAIQYRLGDSYLESGQVLNGNYPHQVTSFSHSYYDLNNNFVKFVDDNTATKNKVMAYDASGQLLTLANGIYSNPSMAFSVAITAETLPGVAGWRRNYFVNGNSLGTISGVIGAQSPSTFSWKFNIDDSAAGAGDTQQPQQVAVRPNDTLRIIAQRVYGDGSLWYILGEANALYDPDQALTEGTMLRVPNNVVRVGNNAEVFKPFNIGAAIGGTSPAVFTQFVGKADKMPSRCQNFANFLAVFVAMVVTAVILVYSEGSASPWVSFMWGLVAGAAGSAAGQGINILAGNQNGFDWNQVATAAISTGIAAGISSAFSSAYTPITSAATKVLNAVEHIAVTALTSAVTQGALVAVGLQDRFSWREVAISSLSSFAADKFGSDVADGLTGSTAQFASALGGTVASAAVRTTMGGKVDFVSLAADVFGNVIGNQVVARLESQGTAEQPQVNAAVEASNAANNPNAAASGMSELIGPNELSDGLFGGGGFGGGWNFGFGGRTIPASLRGYPAAQDGEMQEIVVTGRRPPNEPKRGRFTNPLTWYRGMGETHRGRPKTLVGEYIKFLDQFFPARKAYDFLNGVADGVPHGITRRSGEIRESIKQLPQTVENVAEALTVDALTADTIGIENTHTGIALRKLSDGWDQFKSNVQNQTYEKELSAWYDRSSPYEIGFTSGDIGGGALVDATAFELGGAGLRSVEGLGAMGRMLTFTDDTLKIGPELGTVWKFKGDLALGQDVAGPLSSAIDSGSAVSFSLRADADVALGESLSGDAFQTEVAGPLRDPVTGRFVSRPLEPGVRFDRSSQYPSNYRSGVFEKVLDAHTIQEGPNTGMVMTVDGDVVAFNDPRLTLDHVVPVVQHWNEIGFNSARSVRNDFYNDTSNLALRLRSANSAAGGRMAADGVRYRQTTGPDYGE